MNLPKLMIIGHARHGKDTVCEMLRDKFNFKFSNSSLFCATHVIFDQLKDIYNYSSAVDCYNDRHSHRALWHTLIHEYCKDDPARLGREIFKQNHIYCGLRDSTEFYAMKNQHIFDYAIWVDRSRFLPPEDRSSMNLEAHMADFVIDNNSDLLHLETAVVDLATQLIQKFNSKNLVEHP
jgi:hypothetical protein